MNHCCSAVSLETISELLDAATMEAAYLQGLEAQVDLDSVQKPCMHVFLAYH